ncbi:MAG: polysaccharide biosynthesis C-terminal domain-containing protein, partial [Candidatus Margulisbacteria bacterium]|nr:polysaccharide biosynthesis C-terminal domain-containing protein [Candidatus Margulisiibacteriota bacterium]
MPIVPAMQVLVFAGLVRSIGSTPIFSSVGKPKIETKWQMVRLLVLIAFIYPFTVCWGILGTSLAVFLSSFVSTIGFNYMAIKLTRCEIKEFVKK